MLHALAIVALLSQDGPQAAIPREAKILELREELRIVRARLNKAQHGTTIRVNWQREKEIESELTALGHRDYRDITGKRGR